MTFIGGLRHEKVKKLISFLTAAAMAVTVNLSVAAEAITEPELTDIHGYMCYERDGEYWTMLDGEEYLVIDLDNFVTSDTEEVSINDEASLYSAQSNDSPIGVPPVNWYYCGYVNMTNAGSYSDSGYIGSGHQDSKIFYCPRPAEDKILTARISTKHFFDNAYDITVYIHDNQLNWTGEEKSFHFNTLVNNHVLFTGTAEKIIDGFALRFLTSSTGEASFIYTVNIEWKDRN